MSIENITKTAQQLDKLPDVPFLTKAVMKEVTQLIREYDSRQELQWDQNPAGLFVRLSRGQSAYKILIDSHLDHPGIALRDQAGIALGSVGRKLIDNVIKQGENVPVEIYPPNRDSSYKASVSKINIKGKPMARVSSNQTPPINSQAIWDMEINPSNPNRLEMRSADNDAVTAVAMELLRNTLKSKLDNIDITWFFANVEEVHQISATFTALYGTPFSRIDSSTIVIVLEAMEVGFHSWQEKLIRRLNLPFPNLDNGIALKVNDGVVPYGYQSPSPNLAESLLLNSIEQLKTKVRIQHTMTNGSTNAKSYSLEKTTPHVVTLAVPCRNKHNIGEDEIVPETVQVDDLSACYNILEQAIISTSQRELETHPQAISEQVRLALTGKTNLDRLAKSRRAIMKAALPRLQASKYFPENLPEAIKFKLASAKSKLELI